MEKVFTPIDLQSWSRSQSFYYYTQVKPTSYTVSVSIDVTILRKLLKKRGLKFFPAYLYFVTKSVNKQQELCIAKKDGMIGYWNYLIPTYPVLREEDKTTSGLWTDYNEDFMTFYKKYLSDTEHYSNSRDILPKGVPPENAYVISCMPWFTFNSFSLHHHGLKDYYFPSFEAGGFYETNEKILMPLSITVHHATTDGYHLKILLEELQYTMNHPETYLEMESSS